METKKKIGKRKIQIGLHKYNMASQVQLVNKNTVVAYMQAGLKESPTQPVALVVSCQQVKLLSLEAFSLTGFGHDGRQDPKTDYSSEQIDLEIIMPLKKS